MFIDTHCHLNMIVKKTFDSHITDDELAQIQPIIEQAHAHNVDYMINVGTSIEETHNTLKIANMYDSVFAAIGLHPNDLKDSWEDDLIHLREYLDHAQKHSIIAIGECGLDFHYKGYDEQRQKRAFEKQIELSLEYDLPLIIHTRSAKDKAIDMLYAYKNEPIKGVIHCFSEDKHTAQKALDIGFKIGIGGAVTYPKNDILREAVSYVELDHIILETDAPFLPPQHMRGKKNYPQYVYDIGLYVSQLLSRSLHDVETQTTKNARDLFNLHTI
jgi:TatD DNase family protein